MFVYMYVYISFQISTMVHLKYHATEHRKVGLHMFLVMKYSDLVKNHIYDVLECIHLLFFCLPRPFLAQP